MSAPLKKITDKQFGELLIGKDLISQQQLGHALVIQKKKGGKVGEILIALGYVKQSDIDWALAVQKGLEKKGQHTLTGKILIEKGLINKQQLDHALNIQKEKGGLIGEILVTLGYVQGADLDWALALQKGLEAKGEHKKIGEILIERGLISQDQLRHALRIQREKGGLVGEILVALGYVEETDIALALTSQYGFPYLPLDSYEIDPEIVKIIPERVASQYLLIPIDKFGNNLSIAMSNPLNNEAIEDVELLVGCNVQIFVSAASDIRKTIEKYYKNIDS